MATLLPKKTNQIPVATDDDHYKQMADDPSIKEIPQGSSWNAIYNEQTVGAPAYNTTPLLTQAGDNAGQNAEILVKHSKESSNWINTRWRPAMGWLYLTVCVFDFVIFPIMYTIVQFWEKEAANDAFRQWQPLTLAGAGLFHMAMGAVLGITSYGRTKEKVEGKA